MWYVNATEDLEFFIPWTGRNGGHTSVDITNSGMPRLFPCRESAAKALGHWLAGPYDPYKDGGGWYSVQNTDPARRQIWGNRLAPRKVTLQSLERKEDE